MVHQTNRIKNEAKTHKNNTHFAIHKATNSIAFTWDYKGYDNGELNEFKQDYFYTDIEDNFPQETIVNSNGKNVKLYSYKKDFKIITRKNLERAGIDLNNYKSFSTSYFTQEQITNQY